MLYSPGRAWLRATALLGCQGAASGRPELLVPRTKPLCGETDGAWEPPPWGAGLCVPPLHSVPWEKELSEVQGGNPEGCTARPGCSGWEAQRLFPVSASSQEPRQIRSLLWLPCASNIHPSIQPSVFPFVRLPSVLYPRHLPLTGPLLFGHTICSVLKVFKTVLSMRGC